MTAGVLITCVLLSGPSQSAATAPAQVTQNGVLSPSRESSYRRYAIAVYQMIAKGGKLTVLADGSGSLDTYLVLRGPDGILYSDDDASGTDARIEFADAAPGRWTIVVTAYRAGEAGTFALRVEGATDLKSLSQTDLPATLLAEAFEARGVLTEEAEREQNLRLLRDQLTLTSYRAKLRARVRLSQSRLAARSKASQERYRQNELDEKQLLEALKDVGSLTTSREVIEKTLTERLATTRRELATIAEELKQQIEQRESYNAALAELERLDVAANELARLRRLLEAPDATITEPGDLRTRIAQAHDELERLIDAIATKLMASRLVDTRGFGLDLFDSERNPFEDLRDDDYFVERASDRRAFTSLGLGALAGSLAGVGRNRTVRKDWIDPRVWLPALFPWPPPQPSSRIVLGDVYLRDWDANFKTLGDVDRALNTALSTAGYSGASYWGVSDGFALVAPLEQTDRKGVPLKDESRWSSSIREMKSFSLAEYVRALITAPPGFFRVLVFVVTAEAFDTDSRAEVFSTVQRWAQAGRSRLPQDLQTTRYSDRHRVTVLIYEFVKRKKSELPTTAVPGRHSAPDHLQRSRIVAALQ